MFSRKHVSCWIIVVNSLGRRLRRALKFLVNSPDKPYPITNRHSITLGVREATVVHKYECVL